MGVVEKIFKADDIRGLYGEEIDEDLAWKVGHATGQFLRSLLSGYERGQASSNRLVIGRDERPHSELLCRAMIEGITSSGVGCVDIGACDTPMMYFGINHLGTCGGIQVTGAENPIEYTGFKISGAKARLVGRDTGLTEIQHIVSTLRRMPVSASLAPAQNADLWEEYGRHVLRFLGAPRELKVVIDASNGIAGRMISSVFDNAGIDIVPLNFETSGEFAHRPDPRVEANLKQLKAAVKRKNADMGLCMDGDAGRSVFVDEKGRAVRCDLMIALLARHFLKEAPGATVIYDLRGSRVVAEEIRSAGGVPRRERVGQTFMKKAMSDAHGVFGGDLEGRFYFHDNFNCESAAIALASAVAAVSSQEAAFSELITPLNRYSHSGLISFEVEQADAKLKEIAENFSDASTDWLDGLTCRYGDWWCNIRPAADEKTLQLTLEAKDDKTMRQKLDLLKDLSRKRLRQN